MNRPHLSLSEDSKRQRVYNVIRNYGPLILFLALIIVVSVINPKFISISNMRNIMYQVSAVGIVALGAMFVILTAGIDFTAGVGVAFAGVVAGIVFGATNSVIVMVFVALLLGFVIGLINGLIITRLKIQPFVATLAMMSVLQGFIYIVSEGKIVFLRSRVIDFIGKGNIAGIPTPFVILIIVSIVSHTILNKTKIGRYAFAMGGNEEGARLAGVDLQKYKLFIYILAGIFTGIGAIIMISRISMVAPNIGGSSLLLDAIASTIIGGTSISGGKATVHGTFIGILIMGSISNALNILNVPSVMQDVVKGLIIIIALYFDVIFVNRKRN